MVKIDDALYEERQIQNDLEEEMVKEQASVLKAHQDIAESENRTSQLMQEKRAHMAEMRAACRQQCAEIQQKADKEMREIGRATQEEMDAIRKQMTCKMKETQDTVDSCVKKRQK